MACARTVRGGQPCAGRRLNYNVGPKRLELCNRHLKDYEARAENRLFQVGVEHYDGLHGEGDDRKQFASQYESGEFWLICEKCRSELAGEELGVKPEQVETARRVKDSMDYALKNEERAVTRIKQGLDSPLGLRSLRHNVESALVAGYLARFYRSVQMRVDLKRLWDPKTDTYFEPTLVDAYELEREEVIENLIGNRYETDPERSAAATFVRGSRY